MKTQNRKRLSIQIVTSLLVFLVVLVLGTSHKAQAEPVKMRMGRAGIELLKNFEGCSLKAYKPLPTEKYYTIGYGHYGPDVKEDMVITKEQAEEILKEDLVEYADYVNDFLNKNKLTVTQSQFDALTSFTYNLGDVWKYANRCRLRDYLIDGIDKYSEKEIREAFTAWNRAGGQVLAGLTKRRNAEADLFFSNFDTGYYEVTAQSLNIRMGPEKYYKQIGACGTWHVETHTTETERSLSSLLASLPGSHVHPGGMVGSLLASGTPPEGFPCGRCARTPGESPVLSS